MDMNPIGYLLPVQYRNFFHVLDSCEGEVELITKNGFHLNLKSKLAQYVAMIYIFQNNRIGECELITHRESDMIRMIRFFVMEHQREN
ncbi:MAG: polya polymerase [Roseburia sp.]